METLTTSELSTVELCVRRAERNQGHDVTLDARTARMLVEQAESATKLKAEIARLKEKFGKAQMYLETAVAEMDD